MIIDLGDKLEVQSLFSDPYALTAMRDAVAHEMTRVRRHMVEANGGADGKGCIRSDAKDWRRRLDYLRQVFNGLEGSAVYVGATETIPHI